LFDQFSDRSKRAIFLARELASTKGATAFIEPSHLVHALIREDQGQFAERMPDVVKITGQEELRPEHPFFSPETASSLLAKFEGILPLKDAPIPLSADMALSPTLKRVFTAAVELSKELQNDKVGPLHLLAAVLSRDSNPSSEILMQAGISREAVIAAIPK
jgi:ATP-dependent Clp protease ATP-binding subunit ClpA